ncbi:MAG: cupin domain-containing protein [Actinobacteria bacterium]|nr:cupin domain-containing protein [Actinomycetota bacterium]
MAGYVLGPGQGVGDDPSVKASSRFTVVESETTGGAERHVHADQDEAIYVLDGRVNVECDGEQHSIRSGWFAFFPRGATHSWEVVGGLATVLISRRRPPA